MVATKWIHIHPKDNVAVAVQPLESGTALDIAGHRLTITEDIQPGHKFALQAVNTGDAVVKYNAPIGHASKEITPGSWVHVHNVKTNLSGTLQYEYAPKQTELKINPDKGTFQGFLRPDGQVGIRNEIWIVPTVGCVNEIAKALAFQMNKELDPDSNVDGVYAWPHTFGCSQLGADHDATRKILAGLVNHPNAGGVFILGLGCENNTMESFTELLGNAAAAPRVQTLVAQDVDDEMAIAMDQLRSLVSHANTCKREPMPLSKLVVGLKCGGSDGLSGITGNPLVGRFSDQLIANGGTSLLTEVPEMFGAETLLMNRCIDESVFDNCVNMVNGFKEYFQRYDQVVYENPSPGNKDGGITTLEDKSLGCTQKGGDSPVVDVLDYGSRVSKPGLNLLTGPGNDMVAVTVLAAAGAQLILFTTGRGTPLGAPVPTIKISTNSQLAARKTNWIDFNAGVLVEEEPMDTIADLFFDYVLQVVNGEKPTCNERMGFREIAIFKDGITL